MSVISQHFSHRITIISNIAMFSVLVIHSNSILSCPQAGAAVRFVHFLFSECLCAWAVPFFYIVSGFFFANSYLKKTFSWSIYQTLMRKKLRSLLVPYLLWSCLGLLMFIPLICVNAAITHTPMTSQRIFGVEATNIFQVLSAVFGIMDERGPCGDRPLWYIRTLFLFFACSPLLFSFVKQKGGRFLLVFAFFLIIFFAETKIPHFIWKLGSLGYFLIGIMIAVMECRLKTMLSIKFLVLIFLTLFLCSVYVSVCSIYNFSCESGMLLSILKAICPILGILAVWFSFPYYLKFLPYPVKEFYEGDRDFEGFFSKTFWCYCIHLVPCRYFVSVFLFVFGKSDISCIISLLATPVFSVIVCLISAYFMKRFLPGIYYILSGGRG